MHSFLERHRPQGWTDTLISRCTAAGVGIRHACISFPVHASYQYSLGNTCLLCQDVQMQTQCLHSKHEPGNMALTMVQICKTMHRDAVMSLHLQLDNHVSVLLCCHLVLGLHLLQLVIKICHFVEHGAQFLHTNLKCLSTPTASFDEQRVAWSGYTRFTAYSTSQAHAQ